MNRFISLSLFTKSFTRQNLIFRPSNGNEILPHLSLGIGDLTRVFLL